MPVQRLKIDGWLWFPALASMSMGLGCANDADGRDTADSASSIGSITVTASASATGTDSGSDTDPAGTDSSNATDSGPNTASATDSATTDEDVKFDLGVQPDVEMMEETGCTKVDFLFVIDNSGSMGDNQQDLADNFPNFINGIQATLESVEDFQVGVVTTDDYQYNVGGCTSLGQLVVRTGGNDSSNMQCGPYAEGHNFMTEQDNLPVSFACAAKVGSSGSGLERPMNAVEIAVRKDYGVPGECNEGFIRDDALLVIVIITDEWDGPGDPEGFGSTGDADSWYQTVVDAKDGLPENVVVLSLVHFDPGCSPSDGFLSGGIETFTNMFGPNGFLGCISDDYGQVFSEATSVIDMACDNFVPPG